jgi:hypothetical protein
MPAVLALFVAQKLRWEAQDEVLKENLGDQ